MIRVRIVLSPQFKKPDSASIIKRRFKGVVKEQLQIFGNEQVQWFKAGILAMNFDLPVPKRGGIPLYKTGNYVNSYKAEMLQYNAMNIGPTGMNTNMSNEALGELLEYGNGDIQARPHQRHIFRRMASQARLLGDRISDELLRGT